MPVDIHLFQRDKMPLILNVDHKVYAVTSLAAAASVAAYALYRLHSLKRKLASTEDADEPAKSLNERLMFHYGLPHEIIPFGFGPKSDVDFPTRCAELCIKYSEVKVLAAFMVTVILIVIIIIIIIIIIVGKSSESVQCAITGPCLRTHHSPSA